MSDACFVVTGLCFEFRGAKGPLFNGLNLEVPLGKTTVVFGPSGCGKTTLLNLLGLLLEDRPAAGQVLYRGKNHVGLPAGERNRLRRSEFGFVLQSSYLLPHLSAVDNVAMPLALQGQGLGERRQAAKQLLTAAELWGNKPDLAEDPWKTARKLSGGQRQRVAVLRALVHDPCVVFADEPFSNLDHDNANHTLDTLRLWRDGKLPGQKATQGRTLVLVCHDRDRAWEHGDAFLLLGGTKPRVLAKSDHSGPDALEDPMP